VIRAVEKMKLSAECVAVPVISFILDHGYRGE